MVKIGEDLLLRQQEERDVVHFYDLLPILALQLGKFEEVWEVMLMCERYPKNHQEVPTLETKKAAAQETLLLQHHREARFEFTRNHIVVGTEEWKTVILSDEK